MYRGLSLAEAGVSVLDCDHKTPEAQASGYPYIAIPQIQNGRIVLDGARRISGSDLAAWTRRTKPQAGDVLVTRRGRVGDTASIPSGVECAIGQNIVLLRADGTTIDQSYLRWASRGPAWQSEVNRLRNVGAVFDSLNVRDIAKIVIPVPDIQTQRSIAAVLNALDDKIVSNQRLVSTGVRLLRAHIDAAISAAAQSVSVASLARFVNGGAYTKGATGQGRIVIRIAELNGEPGPSTVRNTVAVPDDQIARPGDILMSWSGTLGVYRWYRDEAVINQHIFKVLPSGFPSWLVYDRLASVMPKFRAIAQGKATTMGHIQRGHLATTEVVIPTQDEIADLEHLVGRLWSRILMAERESERLAELRERLLPGLLSGGIRVAELIAA